MKPITELYYEHAVTNATNSVSHFDSASGCYLTAHFDAEDIYIRMVDTVQAAPTEFVVDDHNYGTELTDIVSVSEDCVSYYETTFEELEGVLGEALLDMIMSNFEKPL